MPWMHLQIYIGENGPFYALHRPVSTEASFDPSRPGLGSLAEGLCKFQCLGRPSITMRTTTPLQPTGESLLPMQDVSFKDPLNNLAGKAELTSLVSDCWTI